MKRQGASAASISLQSTKAEMARKAKATAPLTSQPKMIIMQAAANSASIKYRLMYNRFKYGLMTSQHFNGGNSAADLAVAFGVFMLSPLTVLLAGGSNKPDEVGYGPFVV